MDEIQRWLEASLAADRSDAERENLLHSLMEESDERLFWLCVAITMAETDPWWHDTLVEYARRSRQPNERGETPAPPGIFADWCIGVTAKEIKRPRRRGRPKKDVRDQLICMAVERYRDRAKGGEAVSDSEACGLVADVVRLDDSVVGKIWRRYQQGQ